LPKRQNFAHQNKHFLEKRCSEGKKDQVLLTATFFMVQFRRVKQRKLWALGLKLFLFYMGFSKAL
jgi:hypothetical protein